MKLSESCACGAGFTVETEADATPDNARNDIQEWREMHNSRCHVDLWRRSAGTAQGSYEMGFVRDMSEERT